MIHTGQEQWIRIFDIPETKFHKDGYTVYKIVSTLLHRSYPEASTSLEVWRRYSAILRLHKEIIKISNYLNLPESPPAYSKPSIINRFDDDVIEARRNCALLFFRYCAKHPSIYASDQFTQFFQDESHKKKKKLSFGRFKDKKSSPSLASSLGIADTGLSLYTQLNENTSSSEDLSGKGCEGETPRNVQTSNLQNFNESINQKFSMGTSSSFPEDLQAAIPKSSSCDFLNNGPSASIEKNSHMFDGIGTSKNDGRENESHNINPVSINSNKLKTKKTNSSLRHSEDTSEAALSFTKPNPSSSSKDVSNNVYLSQPHNTSNNLGPASEPSRSNPLRAKPSKCKEGKKASTSKEDITNSKGGPSRDPLVGSPKRKKDVRTRTAEYFQKAEKLISKFSLREGKQWQNIFATEPESSIPKTLQFPAVELKNYRVVGPSGNIIVAIDLTTQETVAIKVIEKVSDDKPKKPILPVGIPFMVSIFKYHETEFAFYLILRYISGGKLWNHLKRFIKQPPPLPPASLSGAKCVSSTYEGQRLIHEEQEEQATYDPSKSYKSSTKLLGADEKITLEMLKALYEEEAREKALTSNGLSASEQNLQEEIFGFEFAQPSHSESKHIHSSYSQNQKYFSIKKIDRTPLKNSNSSQKNECTKRSFEHLHSVHDFEFSDVGLSSFSFSAGLAKEEHKSSCENYSRPCPLEGSNHRCSLSNIVDYSLDQNDFHNCSDLCMSSYQSVECPKSHLKSKSLENLNPNIKSPEKKEKTFANPKTHYQDTGSIGSNTLSGVSEDFSCSSYNPLPDTDISDLGLKETESTSLNLDKDPKKTESTSFDVNFLIKNSKRLIEDVNKTLAKSKQQFIRTFSSHTKEEPTFQDNVPSMSNSVNSITSCYIDMEALGDPERTEPTSVYLSAKSNSLYELENPVVPQPINHESYVLKTKISNDGSSELVTPLQDADMRSSAKPENTLDFLHCSDKYLGCKTKDLAYPVSSPSPVYEMNCYSSVLKEGHQGIPEGLVRVWVSQIISAMDRMHNQDIIWKDFSPSNLLLDEGGSILVTYKCSYGTESFSRGSWFVEGKSEDIWVASLGYISPELFHPVSRVTVASDWWSVGALLFHLLTGKDLASCFPSGITSHTLITFDCPVSEEAASLITNLLCVNPSERLGSSSSSGVQEIKDHPFFSGIEWPE